MKRNIVVFITIISKDIREQDPLKQGLKLKMSKDSSHLFEVEIREQDPLKQGLKQL